MGVLRAHPRPGENRTNCGGCHAHSQKPTLFKDTAAAKQAYELWDLTRRTPLLERPLRTSVLDRKPPAPRQAEPAAVNVEYIRDVKPILERSCVACHSKDAEKPAADLVLDADDEWVNIPNRPQVPGSYYRLAQDAKAEFGHKPVIHNGAWRQTNASRYLRKFQSRRSLLVWKIFGERLDGWDNDDFPSATRPGDPDRLELKGEAIANTQRNRDRSDLDYNGKPMPPPKAVRSGKVQALSDEDRLTIVRWIDLGCPIDLDLAEKRETAKPEGWFADDNRPVLTVPLPRAGSNLPIEVLRIGAFDYGSGLEPGSLHVTASVAIDGIPAGRNLAEQFRSVDADRWEWQLEQPLKAMDQAEIEVSVRDRAGNITRVVRRFSIP